MSIIAPKVDAIINPIQYDSNEMFKTFNIQLPIWPPIIPKIIFSKTRLDLAFIILLANQPAHAPISTGINIDILYFITKIQIMSIA